MAKETQGWVREKPGDPKRRWEVRFSYTEDGEHRYVRRLAKNKAAAERLRGQLINTYSKLGAAGLNGSQMRFTELADKFEKAKLTAAVYRNDRKIRGRRSLEPAKIYLSKLRAHFGNRYVSAIKHADIEAYKNERLDTPTIHGRERTIAACNRELELFRAVLRWAVRNDYLSKSPFEGGDLISRADETQRERILSYEEEARLLGALGPRVLTYKRKAHKRRGSRIPAKEIVAHDTGVRREHLRALVICALDTAARLSELTRLQWRDVDFQHWEIHLQAMTTKTLKSRSVGMTPRVYDELQKLWQESPQKLDHAVFGVVSIKKSFKAACAVAGITNFRFHDLRHTCITRQVDSGLPQVSIMRMSGHTTFESFRRYVNLQSDSTRYNAQVLENYNNARAVSLRPEVEELVQ